MHLRSIHGGLIRRFGALPAALLLALFFFLPLLALLAESSVGGLAAVLALAHDRLVVQALGNSLLLAVTAGSVAVLVGLPLAALLAQQSPQRRRWMLVLLGVPLAFSGLVIAYGFILAYGRSGFVTLMLAGIGADPVALGTLIYSTTGLVLAYAYYLIPRVALMLYPAIVNLDRRPLEAALTLGASPQRAVIDIALRELWPSIAAAWCLVTAIALGTYGTALALVGTQVNILPLLIYMKLSDGQTDFQQAATLSLLLTALCSCVLALGECLVRRR